MSKFAANLTMLFTELPFLERFAAAREAGFAAVEFLFPYEWPAAELGRRLREHGLSQALFNMPPGNWGRGARHGRHPGAGSGVSRPPAMRA